MSDSVRPQRQQPTRLPHLWDSAGKNTGVGCHFLLQCMKVKSEGEVAQSCPTPSDSMHSSLPGSSAHGIFQARVLEWSAIEFSKEVEMTSGSATGWPCFSSELQVSRERPMQGFHRAAICPAHSRPWPGGADHSLWTSIPCLKSSWFLSPSMWH